ncbi:glycosyltransferase family 4 protein [Hymenobacter siberiensis]|uniref:glycosyltransferase family 4 protein n=1 Tax=Hymenobacter siberiensis TaxID=2848396 RepID=UPI001C1E32AF|nr:glycosyltransferase family 4 protein [Hymenobacter siberiensis]MBU6122875.1 glycosyltransferase family 4 protein [Hymenobacter siberiensis]
MNILVVNDTFSIGGAEIFSARLAQALHKAGHKVWLYTIHNRQHIDRQMLAHNAPDVPLVTFESKADWLIEKATSVCRRLHIDFNVREAIVVRHLKQFIKANQIEVTHAHMFVSDYILSLAKDADTNFTRVASMHGTHEGFLHNYLNNYGYIIKDYITKLNKCLSTLDGIVYGTDRNIYFLKEPVINQAVARQIPTRRIYNGFQPQPASNNITRAQLGVQPSDLVFTFMARGVPAKGWPLVIEAFKRLNRPDSHLILIGDNAYVQQLKQEYQQANIHFVGFQIQGNEWINISDVGLLPSTFGESIPTVIVEFLSQGKPLIVTDIAECANMITTPDGAAGFVINLPKDAEGFIDENYKIDPAILTGFMARYFDNPTLLREQAALANEAFEQFSMTNCVAAHIDFYCTAMQHNAAIKRA